MRKRNDVAYARGWRQFQAALVVREESLFSASGDNVNARSFSEFVAILDEDFHHMLAHLSKSIFAKYCVCRRSKHLFERIRGRV